jgi:hypothetical protein
MAASMALYVPYVAAFAPTTDALPLTSASAPIASVFCIVILFVVVITSSVRRRVVAVCRASRRRPLARVVVDRRVASTEASFRVLSHKTRTVFVRRTEGDIYPMKKKAVHKDSPPPVCPSRCRSTTGHARVTTHRDPLHPPPTPTVRVVPSRQFATVRGVVDRTLVVSHDRSMETSRSIERTRRVDRLSDEDDIHTRARIDSRSSSFAHSSVMAPQETKFNVDVDRCARSREREREDDERGRRSRRRSFFIIASRGRPTIERERRWMTRRDGDADDARWRRAMEMSD